MNSTVIRHQATFLLLGCIAALSGCRADVDLKNIDPRIQADMGIALPVGNMLFTTNDFLGGGQVNKICVDADGIFHYIDTISIPKKDFHKIDLSQYVGQTTKVFAVKQQLEDNGYLNASGWVKDEKKGTPITLSFPLTLTLGSINTDPDNERLDSVQVTNSLFTSIVGRTDLNLNWSWINYVDVELNDQFRRPTGKTVRLYTQGDGFNYDTEIPVAIDQYTVSLMKDKSLDPGAGNVLTTCDFVFKFNFTVPVGSDVQIFSTSSFDYQFQTQFISFDAAWGFFQASNAMRDRNVLCLDSVWSDWKNMKKMKMKLMEPAVTVEACHHVAAPLMVYLDTLMAVNASERKSATWDGKTYSQIVLDEVINPYGNLQDSVWNSHLLNYEPSKGHIDQLFEIRPDTLLYSFKLLVDPYPHPNWSSDWKQHRVTPNTEFKGNAIMDIPFKVNKESEIEFVTKINDVNFSNVNFDSLLKSVKEIERSEVRHIKLYLQMANSLPFKVNAKVWFLAQDSTEMNLQLFDGQDQNEVTLEVPKMVHRAGEKYGYVSEPSISTLILDVDSQKFNVLSQCKHLKIDAYMGSNPEPCVVDVNSNIKAQVGVAADVQAIINLTK